MKIGIIGAGQLGRMLALAGLPLGFEFVFQDASDQSPGAQLCAIVVAPLGDPDAVARVASECDLMTIDVENVPEQSLRVAARDRPLWPPIDALLVAQDRILEKQLFDTLGIPTPAYRAVDDQPGLEHAVRELGLPAVAKMRRLGYDGRGQQVLRTPADVDGCVARLGGAPLILERFVPFDCEVSQVAVRGADGSTGFYPLTKNTHRNGILHHSIAPFDAVSLTSEARAHVEAIMTRFDYRGILTVEFFVADGKLVANEIAPRVHNSGHWTIEGAVTSQFENHLRAIAGLPLGSTAPTGHSAMVNLIGRLPARRATLGIERAHLHDYGKTPRPQRKLGHVTLVADTAGQRDAGLATLIDLVKG